MPDGSVRVVVGDDQPITRQGIVSVLEEAGFDVVGVAADAPDLIRKARAHRPDVVIGDIHPDGHGTSSLRAGLDLLELQDEADIVIGSRWPQRQAAGTSAFVSC
jgi:DNA-binding NarL/FixJ family response regulator